MPAFGTFGNAGRNTWIGRRAIRNVNLGDTKLVPIAQTARLQLRLEIFNLLEPRELRPAGRVFRLADVRPDPVGRQPAALPVRGKAIF